MLLTWLLFFKRKNKTNDKGNPPGKSSSIGFGVTVSRDTAHPVFEKDLDAH